MATSSRADISQTQNFLSLFYYVSEIYIKFAVFKKKDQSHSLSITEIINCETGSYLNVQKGKIQATLQKTTYQQLPNTAEISTEPVSYHYPITLR